MSEFGGYTPPESSQKKPGDESGEWKEHPAFDGALAREPGANSPEQLSRSPESFSSGDVNKPFKPGAGDNSVQQNDSTSGNGQSDSSSGSQQQNDQTQPSKSGNDSNQQNDTDAAKLRQIRAELSQLRGNRHDSFRP